MNDDFFVILNTQDGSYAPMIDEDGISLAKFETAEDARDMAKNSVLGEAFGYEVFEIGCGVY